MVNPVERFEGLLAQGKDSPLLRFSLGSHYLGAGEHLRAAGHLRAAVEQDGDYSAAWKLLGRALALAGQEDAARDAFSRGIEAARRRGDKQAEREMTVFLKRLDRAAGSTPRTG